MEPRLNFYKAGPDAMKAMAGLEQQIARSGWRSRSSSWCACVRRR
jgi:hypothetical protein